MDTNCLIDVFNETSSKYILSKNHLITTADIAQEINDIMKTHTIFPAKWTIDDYISKYATVLMYHHISSSACEDLLNHIYLLATSQSHQSSAYVSLVNM